MKRCVLNQIAFRWRADDGPTLNAHLVPVIFQGIRTSIAKETLLFVIFQGGGPDPLSLALDPCMTLMKLNADQKVLQNAPREHSAILLTYIKLPFAFKTFVLSIFEWPLKTGFNETYHMIVHQISLPATIEFPITSLSNNYCLSIPM